MNTKSLTNNRNAAADIGLKQSKLGDELLPNLSDREKQYYSMFEEGIIRAYGQSFIPKDFQYDINKEDGYAEIVHYTGNAETVDVPAVIEGHLVRKISKEAFADKNIKSVKLPSTVTSLGEGLFENCTSLQTLYLPGVISTSHSVYDRYLERMKDFVTVSVNGEVIDFGQLKVDVAYGIKGLYKIKYGFSGKATFNKVVWSKILCDLWEQGRFRLHRTEGIVIPDRMLKGCKSLERIVLSELVTDIGEEFLAGCNQLREVVLPPKRLSVTSGIIKEKETNQAKEAEDFDVIAQEHETYDFGEQLVDVAYGKDGHYKIMYGVSGKITFDNATFGDPIPNTFKEGRYRLHPEIPAGMLRQCASLEKIELPEYAANIGQSAFEGCKSLRSIREMGNLRKIGRNALKGCTNIRRLILPDGIQIMEEAFAGCTALRTVRIPRDCGQIAENAFQGCGNLAEIILSPEIESVGREHLLFRDRLNSLVIKGDRVPALQPQVYDALRGVSILADPKLFDQVEAEYKDKIAYKELTESSNWFSYTDLKEKDCVKILHYNGSGPCVKVPDMIQGFPVVSIGKEAFKDQTDIEEIVLPDSIEEIGDQAFSGCKKLSYLVCPSKVKKLGNAAIDGCSSLRALTFLAQDAQYNKSESKDCGKLRYITINGKTEGGDPKWEDRSKFTIEIEDRHAIITDYKAFDDNQVINETNRYTLVIPEIIDGYPVFQVGKESLDYDLKGVFAGCEELNGVSFPPSVRMIGTKAFYYCTSLETLNLPNRVEKISESCFQECTSLVSVNLQAKRLELGAKAFYGCTRLEAAAIWAKEINVKEDSFAACRKLKTIYFHGSDAVSFPGESGNQFSGIEQLVTVPQEEIMAEPPFRFRINAQKQTVTIQKYADKDRSEIAVIPAYLTGLPVREIADGAFTNNKILKKVKIDKKVQRIGRQAFMGCSSLGQIELPEEMKNLEQEVFSGCRELEQVIFPSSLHTIGEKAFANCEKLREMKLPDTLRTIDREAFSGCGKLERIVLGRSLTTIEEGAFSDCVGLRHIMLPQGITTVRKNTFQGCTELKSVIFLNPHCNKEENSFSGCSIESETICDKIPREPLTLDHIIYRVDAETGEAILCECCAVSSGKLEIPSYVKGFPVTAIADIAFLSNQTITSVLIGENIQIINSMAFYGCDSLEEIVFLHKNCGPRIYREAFYALDKGVVYLSSEQSKSAWNEGNCTCPVFCVQGDCREIGVHYEYDRETAVLLITAMKERAEGQKEISREEYPWHSVRNKIETAVVEGDITCVHSSSFEDCINLKKVVLTEKIERIDRKAFKNCMALSEIVLPENLRYIGEEAFFNCQSIVKTEIRPLLFPDSLQKIDKRAFFGCQGFEYVVFPDSVQEIAARAFQRCEQLKEIYMEHEQKPDKIGGKAFYEAAEGCELSVKFTDSSMLEEKFDRKVIIHVPIEGECGKEENHIVWKLYYDGLLEIEGSGEMADYDGATPPWNAYTVQIKHIVFKGGITHIGAMAFHSCNVESVEFPDGLESIGQEAFAYCVNLSGAKLPSGVGSIGRDCFKGCKECQNS